MQGLNQKTNILAIILMEFLKISERQKIPGIYLLLRAGLLLKSNVNFFVSHLALIVQRVISC